jgi:hypothetical protein
MTAENLERLLQQGEGINIEFKQARRGLRWSGKSGLVEASSFEEDVFLQHCILLESLGTRAE